MGRIATISDLHDGAPGALQRCAPIINAIANRPDIDELTVVVTGDIVDNPTPRNFLTAASALAQIGVRCKKLVLIPGNHGVAWHGLLETDAGRALLDRLIVQFGGSTDWPATYIDDDTCIIAVDTTQVPRDQPSSLMATGIVGEEQTQRVCEIIKTARGRGLTTVLAFHHSPAGGNPALRLIDRHQFGEALEAVGGVDYGICGHLHEKGEWSDVYGMRRLLSSPQCGAMDGYWQIDESGHRWIAINGVGA